jgi:hypothetical protein
MPTTRSNITLLPSIFVIDLLSPFEAELRVNSGHLDRMRAEWERRSDAHAE